MFCDLYLGNKIWGKCAQALRILGFSFLRHISVCSYSVIWKQPIHMKFRGNEQFQKSSPHSHKWSYMSRLLTWAIPSGNKWMLANYLKLYWVTQTSREVVQPYSLLDQWYSGTKIGIEKNWHFHQVFSSNLFEKIFLHPSCFMITGIITWSPLRILVQC